MISAAEITGTTGIAPSAAYGIAGVVALAFGVAFGVAFAPTGARLPVAAPPAGRSTSPDRAGGLIEVLDDIGRDVRTGSSFPAAVDHALTIRPSVLASVAVALNRGLPLGEALAAADVRTPDEALAVHACGLAHRSGAHGADVVEHAASIMRERRAWAAERHAQAAQARLSARVLTWLPMAFALWCVLTSSQVRLAYGTVPLTAVCAGFGVVLNATGWQWMRRIVRGAPT